MYKEHCLLVFCAADGLYDADSASSRLLISNTIILFLLVRLTYIIRNISNFQVARKHNSLKKKSLVFALRRLRYVKFDLQVYFLIDSLENDE